LVSSVTHAATALHAAHVHHEEFEMRGGFGPDLSLEIDQWVRS